MAFDFHGAVPIYSTYKKPRKYPQHNLVATVKDVTTLNDRAKHEEVAQVTYYWETQPIRASFLDLGHDNLHAGGHEGWAVDHGR